jgi:AcrR family transcriptional regulator
MFGKPGRPREDPFLRRREIYLAVAPHLERRGAKRLTMRQVAHAANISLGGIYHYFASKREVVLFGVSPEMFQRSCQDFHQRYGHLEQADPEWLLADGLDAMVAMVSFARPALVASIELGAATALETVEAAMDVTLDDLVCVLRVVRADITDDELHVLQRAVRRVLLGAMLDRSASPAQIHDELRAIVVKSSSAGVREPIGAEARVR